MCDVGSYGAYEGIGTPRKRTSEILFVQLIELEIVTRALQMKGLMLMAVS